MSVYVSGKIIKVELDSQLSSSASALLYSVLFTPVCRIIVRGGGGHFHMHLYGTCRFSGSHFSAKIPEQGIKIDYSLKNNRVLFSLLFSYCLVI